MVQMIVGIVVGLWLASLYFEMGSDLFWALPLSLATIALLGYGVMKGCQWLDDRERRRRIEADPHRNDGQPEGSRYFTEKPPEWLDEIKRELRRNPQRKD